jgi:hypothetical protein
VHADPSPQPESEPKSCIHLSEPVQFVHLFKVPSSSEYGQFASQIPGCGKAIQHLVLWHSRTPLAALYVQHYHEQIASRERTDATIRRRRRRRSRREEVFYLETTALKETIFLVFNTFLLLVKSAMGLDLGHLAPSPVGTIRLIERTNGNNFFLLNCIDFFSLRGRGKVVFLEKSRAIGMC